MDFVHRLGADDLSSQTPGVSGGAVGIVCLEDVFEALIGEEIIGSSSLHPLMDFGCIVLSVRNCRRNRRFR